MTAVRLGESVRYAARMVLALAVATVLGGALVGLGLAVGWPGVVGFQQLASALGAAGGGLVYTAAGGVVILVGVCILAVGYLAVGYKLVADAVSTGVGRAGDLGGEAGASADARSVPGLDESEGDARGPAATADDAARAPAADDAAEPAKEPSSEPVSAAGSSPARPTADPAGTAASGEPPDPPEMSPEEIAFGSSSGNDRPDDPSQDEPAEDRASTPDSPDDESFEDDSFDDEPFEDDADDVSNVTPAGSSASGDPLADPTEDD